MIRPLPITPANAEAVGYVSTTPEEGLAQLEILKSLGCLPHHRVLEIGCGALVAGYPVMQYLEKWNYFGIDPNNWLAEKSFEVPEVLNERVDKRPWFCYRPDFRFPLASGAKFDFIFSHSILSHASFAQLGEFFAAVRDQLAPGGTGAASLRLAEGNAWGSPGSAVHGAAFTEWQYPGVSWFTREEVAEAARKSGLAVEFAPQLSEMLMKGNPKACHDWIVCKHLVCHWCGRPSDGQFRTCDKSPKGCCGDESQAAPASEAIDDPYKKSFEDFQRVAEAHGVVMSQHVTYLPFSDTKPTVTLVTGFFRLPGRDREKDVVAWRDFFELMRIGLPIVLFLDEDNTFSDLPQNMRVIRTSLDTFLAYKIALGRPDWSLPKHRDPKKDTREFLILQNAKLEMMQRALSHCETPHVAWIDFGILKIAKNKGKFLERLRELCTRELPEKCVLAPGCWTKEDLHKWSFGGNGVCWRFCGGFLLADRASVNGLAARFVQTFMRQPCLTWEVNVWVQMERQGVKFDWYKADHDDSIIEVPPELRHTPPEIRVTGVDNHVGSAEVRKFQQAFAEAGPIEPGVIGKNIGAVTAQALRRASRAAAKAVPKICLVMIVKDELRVPNGDGTFRNNIERCLKSALPYIDSWVITDTGSTDGTDTFIPEFLHKTHGKPGCLHRCEFKDFAQARNESLDAARSVPGWDYALLLDADMELVGELDKSSLKANAYKIFQTDPTMDWANVRLVRRDVPAKYHAVTHEYLSVEGAVDLEGLRIVDHNDGASHPEKAARDIRLLRQGLKDEPENERYMFYLANTLREVGVHHEAISWYRKRIAKGGWDEEIWASYYGIARCLLELKEAIGEGEGDFLAACLKAYEFRPFRAEPLMLLGQFFRDRNRNELSAIFGELLSKFPKKSGDKLFVERAAYEFRGDQILSISGFYSVVAHRRQLAKEACARLTYAREEWLRVEARKNWILYLDKDSAKVIYGATTKRIEWLSNDGYKPCNPSIWVSGARRLVLVRTVNYTVTLEGNYPVCDNDSNIIRTRNYIQEFDEDWEPVGDAVLIEDISGRPRNKFPVEGFEDCRLWPDGNGGFCISATVRDLADNPNGHCEMVIAKLDAEWQITDIQPIRDRSETEKNWMPILGKPGEFVYSVGFGGKTTIIDVGRETLDGKTFELSAEPTPVCLRDLRGGSQVIPFSISNPEAGWLCLTHEVVWNPHRIYLHRFVYFDADFRVSRISDPFYFEKVGIEFCAGLARDGDKLVASFAVNDAEAWLCFFDPDRVKKELRKVG